jgi:hypothetical protein
MSDIEFSKFIAIFDIWGLLLLTIYLTLRVLISNIAMSDIEYSDKLAKFDIHFLKFEYTWHVRYQI